jgi:hypothetical protein
MQKNTVNLCIELLNHNRDGEREERERSPRELANIYREVWHMRSRDLRQQAYGDGNVLCLIHEVIMVAAAYIQQTSHRKHVDQASSPLP